MRQSLPLLLAFGALVTHTAVAFDDVMYDQPQLLVKRMAQAEDSDGQVALSKREDSEFMELIDSETAERKKRKNPPQIAVDEPESEDGVAKREEENDSPPAESASEEGVGKRRKRRDARNIHSSSLLKSAKAGARKRRDVGAFLGDADSPYDQQKYQCRQITSPDLCFQIQGCEWKHDFCYFPYSSMSKNANDFVLKWLLRDA